MANIIKNIFIGCDNIYFGFYFTFLRMGSVAICEGRDFEAPTCQAVANLSKCTKVEISHIARLMYIACLIVLIY
jgi:hypothetical protein